MASTAEHPGPFAAKSIDQCQKDADESELKKAIGTLDLTALGIGAVIGTGIFVIIGEAIGDSGPAIVLSFVLAGVTCMFSALSYAEMAAAIPVSGSAYTYAYATMGELIAFIIGWDLILEYGVSIAAIAVGWGGYLNDLLSSLFSIELPKAIANPPGEAGGQFNAPAVFLILAVTAVLVAGIRESARTNTIMVFVKLGILAFFIVVGAFSFDSSNFQPFAPHGFSGVVDAASLIFFAYIGFDAISTASEEVKEPGKTLPRGILTSLGVCTLIYVAVAIVTSGLLPYKELAGDTAPLSTAIEAGANTGPWAADILSFGALVAITSVTLTILYGQTRIFFSMCRDGLLPDFFARVWERTQTPAAITIATGLVAATIAAFVPLAEIAKLVNIGTLFAFVLVNIGVIVLRRTRPDLERPYKVPFVPVVPLIGAALCIFLMKYLDGVTWVRFGIWLAIGLVIYFTYGRRHSVLRKDEAVAG
ncbi:MAG: amino acid permease [Solirubrobacterales bacterium]